jgi:hypothetical protein
MNCEDPKPGFPTGDCGAGNGNYGADIDDNGALSGWAWSTQAGWICFGATCTAGNGAPPGGTPVVDTFCAGHVPCAIYNPTDGEIHGWAYILSQTDGATYRGWVSLNCTDVSPNAPLPRNCGSSDYNVEFDESQGEIYGYAWNGNGDQTGNGWIQLACGFPRPCGGAAGDWGVTTSWVLSGWTSMDPIEGVYTASPAPTTGTHLTQYSIVFRNFSAPDGSTLRCYFRMSNTANYRQVDWPIATRYANEPVVIKTYTITGADTLSDASGNPVPWSFSTPPGPPAYGCEIIGTPPRKQTVSNLIHVHPPTWTFNGPADAGQSDAKRAKNCVDGYLGADPNTAYFLNTVQCDVEGDLAFSLLKAKGVRVELDCRDNVDSDVNLQPDNCITATPDRNCRGITYLCITPVPAGAPCAGTCPPKP